MIDDALNWIQKSDWVTNWADFEGRAHIDYGLKKSRIVETEASAFKLLVSVLARTSQHQVELLDKVDVRNAHKSLNTRRELRSKKDLGGCLKTFVENVFG